MRQRPFDVSLLVHSFENPMACLLQAGPSGILCRGTKNLSGALKDGAQSEDSLEPCSVIVEPGPVVVRTVVVRRRPCMGVPGSERTKKAWFLPPQRTPLSPTAVVAQLIKGLKC